MIALRKRGLLLGREIQFDEVTDWCLMAWGAFQAEQFRADEARKLAIALGPDVVLLQPKSGRVRDRVDPEADQFDTMLTV